MPNRLLLQENFTSPIDRRADYYRQRAREDADPKQADILTGRLPPAQPLLTIPNALTIFRIALVPVLVATYLHSSPSAPLLAAATFGLAAITDWADGYLARRVSLQEPCFTMHLHLGGVGVDSPCTSEDSWAQSSGHVSHCLEVPVHIDCSCSAVTSAWQGRPAHPLMLHLILAHGMHRRHGAAEVG